MTISKEKQDQLKEKMIALGIHEEDIIEKFILGSGKGGQKLNKTNSCVYLQHVPTGIEIKCQRDRSRAMNRFFARRELCEHIENITLKENSPKQQEIEKIRKQKKRRIRRHKDKKVI